MNNRHVALVAFTGFRMAEERMLALGMRLPGLEARAGAIANLPALGLLTLAALTPDDWTCSYHEAPPGRVDELLHEVLTHRPALVALSALTASVLDAYRFSQRLREAGVRTVIGGLHATACPEEAQLFCDGVVVGDGEPVWPIVLHDAQRGELKPLYRSAAPFDLADAPIPRFDLLGTRVRKRLTLQTQRGCPFACEFCGASRLLGRFREKPVERIAAELEAIKQIDPRATIELADDNTFAARRNVEPMLAALRDSGARYFTEADWRVGEREDVLEGLADSGCVQVLVGIESLVTQPAGMGAKSANMPRILNAINAIQASGVCVIGCFIVGCDGETLQSIEALGDFIEQSPFADVQLTVQTPFPGTELHRRLAHSGRLLPNKSWSAYTLFDVTYEPDVMRPEELQFAFYELVQRTFTRSASHRRARMRHDIWRNHPRSNPRFQQCHAPR